MAQMTADKGGEKDFGLVTREVFAFQSHSRVILHLRHLRLILLPLHFSVVSVPPW